MVGLPFIFPYAATQSLLVKEESSAKCRDFFVKRATLGLTSKDEG